MPSNGTATSAVSNVQAGTPVVPAGSTPASVLAGILAPFVIELVAILSVVVIVLIHDGSTDNIVIQALLALILPNGIAGGAVAVSHVIFSRPAAA